MVPISLCLIILSRFFYILLSFSSRTPPPTSPNPSLPSLPLILSLTLPLTLFPTLKLDLLYPHCPALLPSLSRLINLCLQCPSAAVDPQGRQGGREHHIRHLEHAGQRKIRAEQDGVDLGPTGEREEHIHLGGAF